MKATAIAPANIAFIKYWGKKDEKLRLPENGSISMNLSNLTTTTTVEFNPEFKKDLVVINDIIDQNESRRVIKQLDLIRKRANIFQKAKVISKNNFPKGTGLSSSSSGFAALTLAASKAVGLDLSEKELSILARQGSGSSCRSISDGFVEWLDGDSTETSYAVTLYPPNYWAIVDVVAIISQEKKDISSSEGQKLVSTSPFFRTRLTHIKEKINHMKKILKSKNFTEFGELIEEEALELHAIMLTSTPSLIYWLPETVKLMKAVKKWRQEGLEVYFTVNTGQDIHLMIEEKNTEPLIKKLKKIQEIKNIIINRPAIGARLVNKHLF
jgi:diphosphomevalonate decarboxylase